MLYTGRKNSLIEKLIKANGSGREMRRDEWLFTDVASLNTWSTTSAILLCECVIKNYHSPQDLICNTAASNRGFIFSQDS